MISPWTSLCCWDRKDRRVDCSVRLRTGATPDKSVGMLFPLSRGVDMFAI